MWKENRYNKNLNKMIGTLWLNKCQKCHRRASSLLFMPNGCNVLALFINEPLEPFLVSWVTFAASFPGSQGKGPGNEAAQLIEIWNYDNAEVALACLIVNLRIPGLIWRGTAYFVQNNTTIISIILPGDIRRWWYSTVIFFTLYNLIWFLHL